MDKENMKRKTTQQGRRRKKPNNDLLDTFDLENTAIKEKKKTPQTSAVKSSKKSPKVSDNDKRVSTADHVKGFDSSKGKAKKTATVEMTNITPKAFSHTQESIKKVYKEKGTVLEDWVIKPVPDLKGICVEGQIQGKEDFWHSTAIAEAPEPKLVVTSTGSVYKLLGRMNRLLAMEYGISKDVANAFVDGFPHNWKTVVSDYFLQLETSILLVQDCVTTKKLMPLKARRRTNVKKKNGQAVELNSILTPTGLLKLEMSGKELPTTRSGRISLPPLAGWCGQKYVRQPGKDVVHVSFNTDCARRWHGQETQEVLALSMRNKQRVCEGSLSKSFLKNTSQDLTKANTPPNGNEAIKDRLAIKNGSGAVKDRLAGPDNKTSSGSDVKEDEGKTVGRVIAFGVDGSELDMSDISLHPEVSLTSVNDSKDEGKKSSQRGTRSGSIKGKVSQAEAKFSVTDVVKITHKRQSKGQKRKADALEQPENKDLTVEKCSKTGSGAKRRKMKSKAEETTSPCQPEASVTKVKNCKKSSEKASTQQLPESSVKETQSKKSVTRKNTAAVVESDQAKDSEAVSEGKRTRKSMVKENTEKSATPHQSQTGGTKQISGKKSMSKQKESNGSGIKPNEREPKESKKKGSAKKVAKRDKTGDLENKMSPCQSQADIDEDNQGRNSISTDNKLDEKGQNEPKDEGEQSSRSAAKKKTKKDVKDKISHNGWTEDEKDKLQRALQDVTADNPSLWYDVSRVVGTRSEEECQQFQQDFLQQKTQKEEKTKSQPNKKNTGREKGGPIRGGKGTLKRKRDVRDFLNEQNEGYEDDLFAGTPSVKLRQNIPKMQDFGFMDFEKSDSEIFGSNHNFFTPMGGKNPFDTPGLRLHANLASVKKTPAHQGAVVPTPLSINSRKHDIVIKNFLEQKKKKNTSSAEKTLNAVHELERSQLPIKSLMMESMSKMMLVDEEDEEEEDEDQNGYLYYWNDDD